MSEKPITLYITDIENEPFVARERKKHRFDLMKKIVDISAQEEQNYKRLQPPVQNYPQYNLDGYYYPNAESYFNSQYGQQSGYPQQQQYQPQSQYPFQSNLPSYNYDGRQSGVIDIINNANNDYSKNAPVKRGRGRPRKNPTSINGDTPPKQENLPNPKDSDDFYEVRFDDTLQALSELCDEVDEFIDESKAELFEMKRSRTKSQMALTSQTANVTSLFTTKLNVLKEVNATKKIVSDLEIKKQTKKNDKTEAQESETRMLDKLFTKISTLGSAPIPTSLMLNNIQQAGMYQPPQSGVPIGPDNIPPYEAYVDSAIDARLNELEQEGKITYNKSDLAIRYEHLEPEIVVIRDNTNRPRLEALDKEGRLIPGYPTPTVEEVGKIKFTPDGLAVDSYGKKYQVIDI